jgi:hypothetical protein
MQQYPHGKCQELLTHSQHMEAAIGDLVGETIARDLAEQLTAVHALEQLYAELHNDSNADREKKLALLDKAAGLFRATAAYVNVSP